MKYHAETNVIMPFKNGRGGLPAHVAVNAFKIDLSIVQRRVLPVYENRRTVTKIPATRHFTRELVVVVRKNRTPPAHLSGFVDNILFLT